MGYTGPDPALKAVSEMRGQTKAVENLQRQYGTAEDEVEV